MLKISFLSRLCRSEGLSAVADAKEAAKDSPRVDEKSGRACEKSPGRGDERWAAVEELKQQVLDLTRQFSALQRQLQMQGEVSQVAASIEGRLDEVARDLGELGLRARAEDLKKSDEEASRLKEVLIERPEI